MPLGLTGNLDGVKRKPLEIPESFPTPPGRCASRRVSDIPHGRSPDEFSFDPSGTRPYRPEVGMGLWRGFGRTNNLSPRRSGCRRTDGPAVANRRRGAVRIFRSPCAGSAIPDVQCGRPRVGPARLHIHPSSARIYQGRQRTDRCSQDAQTCTLPTLTGCDRAKRLSVSRIVA